MPSRPRVVAFDVMQTLMSLARYDRVCRTSGFMAHCWSAGLIGFCVTAWR